MLENQLINDIDTVLDLNYHKPQVAIALLYLLTLNCNQNAINKTLFSKLVLDYLLTAPITDLIKQPSFDSTKTFQLGKIMRFYRVFDDQFKHMGKQKKEDIFVQMSEMEQLCVDVSMGKYSG